MDKGQSEGSKDGGEIKGQGGGGGKDERPDVHRDLIEKVGPFSLNISSDDFPGGNNRDSIGATRSREEEVELKNHRTLATYSLINDQEEPTIRIPGTPPVLTPKNLQLPYQAEMESNAIDPIPSKIHDVRRLFPFADLVCAVNHVQKKNPSSSSFDEYDFLDHDVIVDRRALRYLIGYMCNEIGTATKFKKNWRIDLSSIPKKGGKGKETLFMALWDDERKARAGANYRTSFMKKFTCQKNDSVVSASCRVVSFDILGIKMLMTAEEDAYDERLLKNFDASSTALPESLERKVAEMSISSQSQSSQSIKQTVPDPSAPTPLQSSDSSTPIPQIQIDTRKQENKKEIPIAAIVAVHTRSLKQRITPRDWLDLWLVTFFWRLDEFYLAQHKDGWFKDTTSTNPNSDSNHTTSTKGGVRRIDLKTDDHMVGAKKHAQEGLRKLPGLIEGLKKLIVDERKGKEDSKGQGEISLVYEKDKVGEDWGLIVWKRRDGSRKIVEPFLRSFDPPIVPRCQ